MRKLQIYVSDELDDRLRAGALAAGVSMSQMVSVFVLQGLTSIELGAAPASSADELREQEARIAHAQRERAQQPPHPAAVVAEPAGAGSVKPEGAAPSSGADQAAPAAGASGGKASSPARRSSASDDRGACPGQPGRGVRCKLCGKTH